MGVAERDGPQAHAVLDELAAVEIPDVAAASPDDESGRALGVLVVALRVRVGAARDELVGAAAMASVREDFGQALGVSVGGGLAIMGVAAAA